MWVNKKSQLIAIQLFDSNSFLTLNKKLLEMFGPNLAVFTCNLVDKYKYFSSRNMIQDDGSFFLTFENQAKDTGMSRCELRSCKKRLIKMRVLKTIMKRNILYLLISQSHLNWLKKCLKGFVSSEQKD